MCTCVFFSSAFGLYLPPNDRPYNARLAEYILCCINIYICICVGVCVCAGTDEFQKRMCTIFPIESKKKKLIK